MPLPRGNGAGNRGRLNRWVSSPYAGSRLAIRKIILMQCKSMAVWSKISIRSREMLMRRLRLFGTCYQFDNVRPVRSRCLASRPTQQYIVCTPHPPFPAKTYNLRTHVEPKRRWLKQQFEGSKTVLCLPCKLKDFTLCRNGPRGR